MTALLILFLTAAGCSLHSEDYRKAYRYAEANGFMADRYAKSYCEILQTTKDTIYARAYAEAIAEWRKKSYAEVYAKNYAQKIANGKDKAYAKSFAQVAAEEGVIYAENYFQMIGTQGEMVYAETYARDYARMVADGKDKTYAESFARAEREKAIAFDKKQEGEIEKRRQLRKEWWNRERERKRAQAQERAQEQKQAKENLAKFEIASAWAYNWAINQGANYKYAKSLGAYYANFRVFEGESHDTALSKAISMANYVPRPR